MGALWGAMGLYGALWGTVTQQHLGHRPFIFTPFWVAPKPHIYGAEEIFTPHIYGAGGVFTPHLWGGEDLHPTSMGQVDLHRTSMGQGWGLIPYL